MYHLWTELDGATPRDGRGVCGLGDQPIRCDVDDKRPPAPARM